MTKNKGLPGVIILNGVRHIAVVMKVQNKYDDGMPQDLTLLREEMPVEIVGGEEFMVAYVKECIVKKQENQV